jgi:hypothetical protein
MIIASSTRLKPSRLRILALRLCHLDKEKTWKEQRKNSEIDKLRERLAKLEKGEDENDGGQNEVK